MKIISTYRIKRTRFFKFFKWVFCIKIANKYHSKYKKYYFKGLLRAYRRFNPLMYTMEHKIFFYKFLVFRIIEQDNYRCYYFRNLLLRKFPLKKYITKHKYYKKISKHDNVFILNANSGEIYLFLMYALDLMLKKFDAKKPLLIATKKYHIEMIRMICPDVPYIFMTSFYQNIKEEVFEINNTRFIKIFSTEHFFKVEQLIKESPNAHYFDLILDTLKINREDIIPRNIIELEDSKKSMMSKIQKLNLNLDNFVFLSPEAASCELLSNEFWINLIIKLQEEGYDVFVNLIKPSETLGKVKCKSCYLTYSEAFSLVNYAKKIYSLRSGFTEFLLHTKVPMEVYYTPFRCNNITGEQIKTGFGLLKIPDSNPELIKEIVMKN